ncbi:MAG: endonuclease/exonuclease/phosphatase family protein, partial [Woeseiaceae bacterium]
MNASAGRSQLRAAACVFTVLLLSACTTGNFAAGPTADGLAVDVQSFNIRYGTADDGANAWMEREDLVYDVIRRHDSDFVGLQEALRFQLDGIRESVPGYAEVGVGREDGKEGGEYSAILYRAGRWRPELSGTLWLSDTPEVPGSKSWGNEITRIVTWARFVEKKTGRAVWMFNTHFDHISQPSRQRSAELLARRIADREPRDPVVVTGDFNAGEDNRAILYLKNVRETSPVTLVDTFRVSHPDVPEAGTFGEFTGIRSGPKIDYIFVEPDAAVNEAGIIYTNRNGR